MDNNTIYNQINQFNELMYGEQGPVSVYEYVSDKNNVIHEQLFNDALQKYINSEIDETLSVENFKQLVRIIEIKQKEYWKPSTIIYMINNSKTHKKLKAIVDLTPYWNTSNNPKDKHNDIKVLGYTDINDFEIIDINYIKGEVTLCSKTRGIEITIPFSSITGDIPVSEDYMISDTFSYKLKNKIYGR